LRDYILRGKVIDERRLPVAGARVQGWDDDPLLNPDDPLGEAVTDQRGCFELRFDPTKFASHWEFLEGSADVYLVVMDASGQELLRTRVQSTGREIEYHIRAVHHLPAPDAPDVYAGAPQRYWASFNDVGAFEGEEHHLNINMLGNTGLPPDVRQRLQEQVQGHEPRLDLLQDALAILDGIVTEQLEERGLKLIGYDGPQVPERPWRASYDEVIQWPRGAAPWA
jgi:hypothetical protein